MRSPLYRRALARDLEAWIEEGLVDPGKKDAILARVGVGGSGDGGTALAGLSGLLLGLAVVTFMAANWGAMNDVTRLGVLALALWGALGAAYAFLARGSKAFGHAFALVGALIFGACVMLVAQAFNIQAHYPRGALIWAVGALGVGMLLEARPATAAAVVIGTVWVCLEYLNPLPMPFAWGYLVFWAAAAFIAARQKSGVSAHLLGVGAAVFTAFTLGENVDAHRIADIEAVALFGVLMLTGAAAAGYARERDLFGAGAWVGWFALAAAIAAFLIQFGIGEGDDLTALGGAMIAVAAVATVGLAMWRAAVGSLPPMVAAAVAFGVAILGLTPLLSELIGEDAAQILFGAAFFAASSAAIALGARDDRRTLMGIGVAAFFAEAIYVYFQTFGDLLGTSAFFLVGGVLLSIVAALILRARKRAKTRAEGATP